jgi:hypothetical protein
MCVRAPWYGPCATLLPRAVFLQSTPYAPQAESYRKVGRIEEGGNAVTGAGLYRENWRTALRGRTVSAEKGASSQEVSTQHPALNISHPSGGGSRSIFPQSDRDCSQAKCEVVGAAGDDELGAAVAAAGQEGRGPADSGRDLWLVYRGV